MAEDKANFALPEIQVNPNGWGPNTIESKFKDMPYQPFSKADRLGKVSEKIKSCLGQARINFCFVAVSRFLTGREIPTKTGGMLTSIRLRLAPVPPATPTTTRRTRAASSSSTRPDL